MEDIRDTLGREGLERFSGCVEGIIYANEENGYTVFDFALDSDEVVTATGTLPYLAEGDATVVYGKWVHNPKYGTQLQVVEYESIMPESESAMLRYLASGAVKGIGPKLAARIVAEFGEDTFDVIENHPEWLAQVHGVSRRRALEVGQDFRAKAGMRSAMMLFREPFGAEATIRIYRRWGSAAIELVKRNPYALCNEIEGIGFDRVDSFADTLGFSKDSPERVREGVRHVLRHNISQNGHTCLPKEKLILASAEMLGVSEALIGEAISEPEAVRLIHQLAEQGLITVQEAEIMRSAVSAQALSIPIPDTLKAALRARMLKTMLMTIARQNRDQGGAVHG